MFQGKTSGAQLGNNRAARIRSPESGERLRFPDGSAAIADQRSCETPVRTRVLGLGSSPNRWPNLCYLRGRDRGRKGAAVYQTRQGREERQ